jgi:hypothetical protein
MSGHAVESQRARVQNRKLEVDGTIMSRPLLGATLLLAKHVLIN